jgi:hypothetical protein
VVEIEGRKIRCNENHLFESSFGWVTASEILRASNDNHLLHLLIDDNTLTRITSITKTDNIIPIVDITVDHPNHRYYTDGVSSHNTGVGKSFFMCHHAASCIRQGYNALYITLEMAEEKIAERIDCNLLGVPISEMPNISKVEYESRFNKLLKKTHGKLIIKEYPTASSHAGHFRALLEELKMKKNFIPDIIFIDYLNICSSQRFKGGMSGSINSYSIIKAIAEELRGLAVEYNVAIMTATQTNRGGFGNSDIDMSDTSESAGVPMTVDDMFAMIRTEELDGMGQVMIKRLKSRYSDINWKKRFVIGADISKFTLFDIAESETNDLTDTGRKTEDVPGFDKSAFGSAMKKRGDYGDLNFE